MSSPISELTWEECLNKLVSISTEEDVIRCAIFPATKLTTDTEIFSLFTINNPSSHHQHTLLQTPPSLVMFLSLKTHISDSVASLKESITPSELGKILKLVITLYCNLFIGPLKKHSHCLSISVTTSIFNIHAISDPVLSMIMYILGSDQLLCKVRSWKEVQSLLQTQPFQLVPELQKTLSGLEIQSDLSRISNQFKTESLKTNPTQLLRLPNNDYIKSYHFTIYSIIYASLLFDNIV